MCPSGAGSPGARPEGNEKVSDVQSMTLEKHIVQEICTKVEQEMAINNLDYHHRIRVRVVLETLQQPEGSCGAGCG